MSNLQKGTGWENYFNIVGKAVVNDYTFKIDEKATKSDWVYNTLNLGIDCGENGVVYSEMMGGYGAERDNVVYVHGVKEVDGKNQSDFENRFTIAWEDRFDEKILETIGDLCFIKVGLEKDTNNKTHVKKFLSPYDAISYINEHLESDMIIRVNGQLKYQEYLGNTQVRKEVQSVFLSKVEDENKFEGGFTQTVLITKDSAGDVNKEKSVIPVYAKVLDYTKMYNGAEVKTTIPFDVMFELEVDIEDKKKIDGIYKKILAVKKGVTQITFEGEFKEGGAVVTTTIDDVPDDIKDLIGIVYTEEEAIAKCSESGGKEKRMIITKPTTRWHGDEDNRILVLQKFEEKYTEEDLVLDFMQGVNAPPPLDEEEDTSLDDILDFL